MKEDSGLSGIEVTLFVSLFVDLSGSSLWNEWMTLWLTTQRSGVWWVTVSYHGVCWAKSWHWCNSIWLMRADRVRRHQGPVSVTSSWLTGGQREPWWRIPEVRKASSVWIKVKLILHANAVGAFQTACMEGLNQQFAHHLSDRWGDAKLARPWGSAPAAFTS